MPMTEVPGERSGFQNLVRSVNEDEWTPQMLFVALGRGMEPPTNRVLAEREPGT